MNINLSEPFIRRPIMTTLIMLGLLFFGIFAYQLLPVNDLPYFDYPTITVTAAQPGGSPQYMADLIATPLERSFAGISGIKSMASTNTVGTTKIVLNFELNVNLAEKEVELAQAITAVLPNLPALPYNPTYEQTNPSETPIIFLTLTSESQTLASLYEIGYNILAQSISTISGVSSVDVYGQPYAVRIQADPMKLAARSIDFITLSDALMQSNPNLPSGVLQGPNRDMIVNTLGMISIGEDYEDVVINQTGGIPLFVGNVARGLSALEYRDPYFRYITADSSHNTVVLAVSRLSGSNTIQISEAIRNKLPDLQKVIPASIKLNIFYDKAGSIIASVFDVKTTLVIALILVVTVIFLSLGKFIDALIPTLVLPMAIVTTFIVMYILGFSLDNLSLLALTLSIGFMVDDSIVVLENIVRYTEKGDPAYQAALDGSKQISTTVLTMSLALSAVFIPFIWMPGILGRVFHEFSLTIITTIYCSGIISLTLNPMLCSKYLRKADPQKKIHFSKKANAKLVGWYENLLHHSIRFRKITLFVGIICFILSLLFFQFLKTDFIPIGNLNLIRGLHLCQQGASKRNTIRHMEEVNEIMRKYPYQDGFLSIAGYPASDDEGIFFMRLIEASRRPNTLQIATQLTKELSQVVGIDTYLRPFPLIDLQVGSTTSLGEYQYVLSSPDAKNLYRASAEFTRELVSFPELNGVNSDLRIHSPQINVNIDRDRAGVYGITAQAIEGTFQFAYSGGRISTFSKKHNLYDLILEAAPEYDLTADDLDLLYIKSPATQALVPMTSVATWDHVLTPSSINHINTLPAVTISFNLAENVALGPVLEKISERAQKTLPSNVVGFFQGPGEVFFQTFKSIKWLLFVAIVVIYLILGILYESFIHPITVLSALPIAALGGLVTLWIFNLPLSLYSSMGLIVLIGIVQKNGIMLIDFALEFLEKRKETPYEAIMEASRVRFRPIMMTTFAAMAGALPIAIGYGENASINRPLGLVIFGGLLFSQLITLFVTPVVFLYMQDFQAWLEKRHEKK
jgi:HAE1 family hydrophobic/amphiphilic exporter-1